MAERELLERWRSPLVAAVTLGAVAARVALALRDDGQLYPDEVFQSLEQGHRLAFGYGLIPWEFEVGARPWLLPALTGAAMKSGAALGLAPQLAARLLFALGSGLTAWACARLVRALQGAAVAQVLAAATWAVLNLAVLMGTRGLSESACTFPLVVGLALCLERGASGRRLVLGAVCLGVAVMFRLHAAVFAAAVPLVLLARRERRPALTSLAALAAMALVFGLFDLATWGSLFHSAREYLTFNLVEGRAASFGTSPPSFYSGRLLASMGPLFVVLCGLALAGARRGAGLATMTLVYFALHLATAHKELRFMLPALPLLVTLAALGVDALWQWNRGLGQLAALGTALALSLGQPTPGALTFRQLGIPFTNRELVALDEGGAINRLLARAGRLDWVCGLEVQGRELGYTGAFSWLHKDVPLYDSAGPPPDDAVNAIITLERDSTSHVIAEERGWALIRTREQCHRVPWVPKLR